MLMLIEEVLLPICTDCGLLMRKSFPNQNKMLQIFLNYIMKHFESRFVLEVFHKTSLVNLFNKNNTLSLAK